ncbi:MAG TPA: AMP-binding protein [Prolixibacteraceae bacterium]|nr:AMP-binding protein [Prolixibacteraceae bacterium]
MNCIDFLFKDTYELQKDLILGTFETISYRLVYENSYKLASYLQKNTGTGKNIILIANNSVFFIVAYLGIIKSGNICVPLNPAIEQSNFDFIQKKTKCDLGFISQIVLKRFDITIDNYSELNYQSLFADEKLEDKLENDFDENQIAEIIFTSGSTSTPKGVMLSHNNIISNTNSIIQYLKISEYDIIQVVLPFFYCYGLSLLHTHIRIGGQLVLNNNFIFLASTIHNINKFKCTGFAGVPSHFQILLRKTELFRSTKFPTLRYVTQAGGKLSNVFIDEFTSNFPDVNFYVMYGQTEATARLSYLPPHMLKDKQGSIGKGIPDVELMVVDEEGQNVKVGTTGEIIARGQNIMAGYFDDPDETKNTIRNGWLYTGDLGTVDHEGFIYLTARKKEIIKVGGKRVSPKEIEEIINMIPEVIDCSVEAIQDEFLGEGIMATIITDKINIHITAEYIRGVCSLKLSSYKIPSKIVFKDSMELSTTGKKIKSV